MHPDLFGFHLFGQVRVVHTYGLLLVTAGAVGCLLTAYLAPRRGVSGSDAASVSLLGVASGLLGAGLLDAIVHWRIVISGHYVPGLVFYGGFLGAAPAVWLFARRFSISLRALGDVASVSVPVAHAIGRMGCLFGGCCYGAPAGSWPGIIYRAPGVPATALSRGVVPLHPVPIYEAAGLLAIAGVTATLFFREKIFKGRLRGRLFLLYLGLYGALRFSMEFLRADTERGALGPLTTSQAVAILVFLFAVVAWRRLDN
ncbi:MAG: prolipoprotein diacylglyceryl transferase [Deltaproteobacteria bacterium]|nr:prolipoprotein diacylglyceryl transferase [Deltaproteobacteria bacterium]